MWQRPGLWKSGAPSMKPVSITPDWDHHGVWESGLSPHVLQATSRNTGDSIMGQQLSQHLSGPSA